MNNPDENVLVRNYTLPKAQSVSRILKSFSPFERLLFFIFTVIFVVSGVILVAKVNNEILVVVPAHGGSFSEGVVGSPRFINPLLAQSEVDRDLTSLVYSGLMHATRSGELAYDLARGHTVSEDGLVYTFTLKDDLVFHDGEPLTTDDVLFTIKRIQDPTRKSPRRASWEGVIVEKASDTEIIFTLARPYSPFLENLTLGILPEHLWEVAPTDEFSFNTYDVEPIGTGPYAIKSIKRNSSGIPEYYDLEAFSSYSLGKPLIKNIRIRFYTNEDFLIDGYINGEVDSINSVSPKNLAYAELNVDALSVTQVPLLRIFGVFFNQNEAPVFAHSEVRKALDVALDKDRIIQEVLHGFATVIDSPIPPSVLPPKVISTTSPEVDETTEISRKKQAIDILQSGGWKVNEESGVWEKKTKEGVDRLEFSISTSNAPELKQVGEFVKEEWESIGASVTLKIFETGDLNQQVIRSRKYDALLFGEVIGRELDLFAFWHSSQRNDPGLNVAMYANITVDAVLEKARATSDKEEKIQKFIEFEKEIALDRPAIFIYAPNFIYITPKQVKGIDLGSVTTPNERFLSIHEWYIHTDKIWSFFVQEQDRAKHY